MEKSQLVKLLIISHKIMHLIDDQSVTVKEISEAAKDNFDKAYEEIGVAIALIENEYSVTYDDWGNPSID